MGDERFSRFSAIKWWDQGRMRAAKVLVIGAGALGNEVIKNLALLGVGNIVIVDMDRIEKSNLSRSVLFRETDEGAYKSQVAARRAQDLFPAICATGVVANILAELGLGYFRWADVIVGALDNREARVFVNQAAARTGRAWIDGGIDILNGIVRGFAPPATACYECTMGEADWKILNQRRSCSLLARRAAAEGGTPTTPTTASIIGAMQAQEVVKRLHGLETLEGRGFVFEGLSHHSFDVSYPISKDCPWHEPAHAIEAVDAGSDTPLADIWRLAGARIGKLDALDFSREIVDQLECPVCHTRQAIHKSLELILEHEARCTACRGPATPHLVHSVGANAPLLALTPRQIGLPTWDIFWARGGDKMLGIELARDRPEFAAAWQH